MRSITSQGKDIEEAVDLGLKLLDVTKKEVDIEIVQAENKGFMGLGKQKAVVKLYVNENHNYSRTSDTTSVESNGDLVPSTIEQLVDTVPSNNEENHTNESDISSSPSHLDGKVWVECNQIFVKDSPSHFSTVTIGEGIQLIKNSSIVQEKTTTISQKDILDIKIENGREKETIWNIYVDTNKLNVRLHIEPGHIINNRIKEILPDEHIELEVEETKEVKNTLEYEEVMKELDDLHVVYGINQHEIMKAVNTNETGTFEIATGKTAEPGQNGWIELKVDVDTKNGLIEDESGKVDFREKNLIPKVDKGQIIALIHTPIPGTPGITVTNEPLPSKPTYPIKLKAGEGIIEVENKLVATESGRPSIEIRGQLVNASIVPKYVHNDNVNLSSGNIRFNGDVDIMGEVEENMHVESKGDIYVFRAVNRSTLTTTKSIIAKENIAGSELAAGKNNMLIAELGHLLGILNGQLENMMKVIKQLSQSTAFKSSDVSVNGLQPLITILLERKFKGFIPLVNQYQNVVNNGGKYLEDDAWSYVSVSLTQIFLTLSNQLITIERLESLSQKMKELHQLSQDPVEPDSYITISEAINSSLYCSGNINVIGKGCINTKIHAGGQLNILGVVRGGEVYGRLGIKVNEVGSKSGTKTKIAVPSDQVIHISKAMEGTKLQIGNVSYTLTQNRNQVYARLNQSNQLIFE